MTDRLNQLYTFLADTPQDPFLHYAIASELMKLGREQEALEKFVQVIEEFPSYVGTYYHLGKLYEALGQVENAIVTYEKGMTVARSAGNRHALNELQAAWKIACGADEDDEEDWD